MVLFIYFSVDRAFFKKKVTRAAQDATQSAGKSGSSGKVFLFAFAGYYKKGFMELTCPLNVIF